MDSIQTKKNALRELARTQVNTEAGTPQEFRIVMQLDIAVNELLQLGVSEREIRNIIREGQVQGRIGMPPPTFGTRTYLTPKHREELMGYMGQARQENVDEYNDDDDYETPEDKLRLQQQQEIINQLTNEDVTPELQARRMEHLVGMIVANRDANEARDEREARALAERDNAPVANWSQLMDRANARDVSRAPARVVAPAVAPARVVAPAVAPAPVVVTSWAQLMGPTSVRAQAQTPAPVRARARAPSPTPTPAPAPAPVRARAPSPTPAPARARAPSPTPATATATAIANIPDKYAFLNGKAEDLDSKDLEQYKDMMRCEICLTNIKDVRLSPCDHQFCKECIRRLINRRETKCPKCRVTFTNLNKVYQSKYLKYKMKYFALKNEQLKNKN